jgi:quinoprotein glucose dehydrogenase
VYGGTPAGLRYSSLDQINRSNVSRMELAWNFETGDSLPGSEMQCNPIVVEGVLFVTTPKLKLVALNAKTGQKLRLFDPNKRRKRVRHRAIVVCDLVGKGGRKPEFS